MPRQEELVALDLIAGLDRLIAQLGGVQKRNGGCCGNTSAMCSRVYCLATGADVAPAILFLRNWLSDPSVRISLNSSLLIWILSVSSMVSTISSNVSESNPKSWINEVSSVAFSSRMPALAGW